MGLRSMVVVLGAVLLIGPSPAFCQAPVRSPGLRVIVRTAPSVTPYFGSQSIYLASGSLGSGAFVSSGNWVSLNRGIDLEPSWTFLGNTQWGDNTWQGIFRITYFYHSSQNISGAYGVISWPKMVIRLRFRCDVTLTVYDAWIEVGPGTRAGVLETVGSGQYLATELLDTVFVSCGTSTNYVQGAWLTNSYAGRWFDVEGWVSTNAVGAQVVTNRFTVGGVTVREVVVNVDSNTVTSFNILSNEVAAVVGATGATAQQVMGSVIAGGIVRSVGGAGGGPGEVDVSITVTNDVNVDWSEGHQYSRDQLPSTNWTWVLGSVQSSVAEAFGEPGQLSGVSAGHGVASPTWSIPVRMPSGVWSWNFDVGIWSSGLGVVVKRILEVFVLLGLWFMLHRQIVDDLRAAWGAPQARSAGQTVLGTGSQLAGALVAAAAILATLLTLSAAVLAWFLGGVGYPQAWVGELSLPSGLLGQFLRIGPWEVIVSSLTVWVAVWFARPYWIALTHGVVRFITGV